jgi:transposase
LGVGIRPRYLAGQRGRLTVPKSIGIGGEIDTVDADVPLLDLTTARRGAEDRHKSSKEWLHKILVRPARDDLELVLNCETDLAAIVDNIRGGDRRDRNKGIVILAQARGIPLVTANRFLGISKNTCRAYIRKYRAGGCDELFMKQRPRVRKCEDASLKETVFSLLHEPPSAHGFNRSSWRMKDLTCALAKAGAPACSSVVREIVKKAGYKWRKAKVVLTSTDPDYAVKLGKVQDTLRALRPDEAFFSIDEFGPFAVKAKPGRALVGPGQVPSVDQWQKSRGCLIITAALELSGNQVSHFYSAKKNTDEMIKMMSLLVSEYRERRRIFLSWDAASWHMSKKLEEAIQTHNLRAGDLLPKVELVPLPASAQFLNVIESVFSGMARAIIHNSNYASVDEAKQVIDRHFRERNQHFRTNQKRAGRKIWGMERESPTFTSARNCKDPRFR